MKEIQMFPQITEETEENLLTLEGEVDKSSSLLCSKNSGYHKKSSMGYSTAPTSPCSPVDNGHSPASQLLDDSSLPVPRIVAEYVDANNKVVEESDATEVHGELATPPPRVRMRSLSGGAYRLSPVPPVTGRMRRQSGDDALTSASPLRRAAFLDAFRPRSKSDSKSKKPTFLSTLKNSFFSTSAGTPSSNSNSSSRKNSVEQTEPLFDPAVYRQRSRSGSETRGGAMSKVMDMFRNRSNSVSSEQRGKKKTWGSNTSNVLTRRYSVDPDRRKYSLTNTYRSLELPFDYHQCPRSETVHDINYIEDTLAIPKFFDINKCYDIMPKSGKVLILNDKLQVDKAFHSLVGNLMRAAPIWDSEKMRFIGMLTITDFIDVLILYYNSSEEQMKGFEGQKICTWRSITNKPDNFIHIHPEASLTDAIRMLVYQQVHRLPVYDPTTSSVLFVLTHKRILKYFYLFGLGKVNQRPEILPKPSCLRKSIRELNIGTYENIATATLQMTVIEALRIFVERKVSALPVVDSNAVINIYAKFDVLALAKENTYRNLDMTIKDALQERGEVFEKVVTCTPDDTLEEVIDKIVDFEVHRIVVVDSNESAVGMISLSDIIKFLVLQPQNGSIDSSTQSEAATNFSELGSALLNPDFECNGAETRIRSQDFLNSSLSQLETSLCSSELHPLDAAIEEPLESDTHNDLLSFIDVELNLVAETEEPDDFLDDSVFCERLECDAQTHCPATKCSQLLLPEETFDHAVDSLEKLQISAD